MKIVIVGAGYVGLVSAACFTEYGNDVTVIDVDEGRIERLQRVVLPIYEPGLEDLIRTGIADKRLHFAMSCSLQDVDVVFLCVGTPEGEDGAANLDALKKAAHDIAKACQASGAAPIIAIKSTVPVGTSDMIRRIFADFHLTPSVASIPEFLKEGTAIRDFMRPDRVVIGLSVYSEAAEAKLRRLYRPFVSSDEKILVMDNRSAEITKYAANALLATRISFMNEIANLCDAVGADVSDVRAGVGSDSRIGPQFLYAGPGYGGSCFPKDVRALVKTATDAGVFCWVAASADVTNDRQKTVLCEKLRRAFPKAPPKRVCVWGLSFKPDTDDVRESPALDLIKALSDWGVDVVAYDPQGGANALHAAEVGEYRFTLATDRMEALEGCEALVLVTEWREFRAVDWKKVAEILPPGALVLDGRNIWDAQDILPEGLIYEGIGRG